MGEKERRGGSQRSGSLPGREMPEQTGGEVNAHYWDSPAPPPVGKEIHERQYIPPVPEGEDVPDEEPSAPVELE